MTVHTLFAMQMKRLLEYFGGIVNGDNHLRVCCWADQLANFNKSTLRRSSNKVST